MDNYINENDTISSEQLFFKINNKQFLFKTDKRTVDKLNDGMCRYYIKLLFIIHLIKSFLKIDYDLLIWDFYHNLHF